MDNIRLTGVLENSNRGKQNLNFERVHSSHTLKIRFPGCKLRAAVELRDHKLIMMQSFSIRKSTIDGVSKHLHRAVGSPI